MKLFTATAAVLAATTIAATAMTDTSALKNQVQFMGFNADAVDTLSEAEIVRLQVALHGGSDSDIRGAVASILK